MLTWRTARVGGGEHHVTMPANPPHHATSLILEVLARDPRTPGETLAYIASLPTLGAGTVFGLATHPSLPPDVALDRHVRDLPLDSEAFAAVPARQRRQILDAQVDLMHYLAHADFLTAEEVARTHARYAPDYLPYPVIFANYPRTPRELALRSLEESRVLLEARDEPHLFELVDDLRYEAASVRLRVPSTPRVQRALSTADPEEAYARLLLEDRTGTDLDEVDWWEAALDAYPHPTLLAAALEARTTSPDPGVRRTISLAFYFSPAVPQALKTADRALWAADDPRRATAAVDAPDHLLSFYATNRDALHYALSNPSARADTLRELHLRIPAYTAVRNLLAALTANPRLPGALRESILDNTTEPCPLGRALHEHGTAPGDLYAAPWAALANHGPQHQALHWASSAYTAHPGAQTLAPGSVAALVALTGAPFEGTFRDLLTTSEREPRLVGDL